MPKASKFVAKHDELVDWLSAAMVKFGCELGWICQRYSAENYGPRSVDEIHRHVLESDAVKVDFLKINFKGSKIFLVCNKVKGCI